MAEPETKHRRRWFQFSLRSLMLFMFVCAVASAWVGSKLDETRREQVVVAGTEPLWVGSVEYHEMYGPDWLARHFRTVLGFNLKGTQVTDAGLVHLKGLTNLKEMHLSRTQVTDAGLVHLKGLTNLEWLYLSDAQLAGAGSLQLALPNCRICRRYPGYGW